MIFALDDVIFVLRLMGEFRTVMAGSGVL